MRFAYSLAGVACALARAVAAQGCVANQVEFESVEFPIGPAARDLVIGDWNNDGELDLVTTSATTPELSVLLGAAAVAFVPTAPIALANAATSIASGDVDGDGHADLVVAEPGANRIELLRGDGLGGFAGAGLIVTTHAPGQLALAAFDADALPDLAVALPAPKRVDVFLGQVAGGFAPFSSASLPTPCALLRSGDLDVDGRADLCAGSGVGGSDWKCYGLLGDGAGHFGVALPSWLTGAPLDLELADLDQDGRPDLVTPTWDLGDVLAESRRGLGSGMFAAAFDAFACAEPLVLADLDVDGHPDGVGRRPYWTTELSWCLGMGGVEFWNVNFEGNGTVASPPDPKAIAAADFDGDGDPDVACAGNAGALRIYRTASHPLVGSLSNSVPSALALPNPGQVVIVKGSGFECIESVRVDGVLVPPGFGASQQWSLSSASLVNVGIPLLPHQGVVPIEIAIAGTVHTLPLTILPTIPPLLSFAQSPFVSLSQGSKLRLVGRAGDTAFIAVSLEATPTVVPGVFSLLIGANGASLWLLDAFPLGAPGWQERSYSLTPGLALSTPLHLQALTYDPLAPVLPFAASNKLSTTVVP